MPHIRDLELKQKGKVADPAPTPDPAQTPDPEPAKKDPSKPQEKKS